MPPPRSRAGGIEALDGLERRRTAFVWSCANEESDTFDSLPWPIVLAAAELLTSDRRTQIHECGGEGCGWLFLDTSRNRRRRWCTMRGCGNRAKARRFYERMRVEQRCDLIMAHPEWSVAAFRPA